MRKAIVDLLSRVAGIDVATPAGSEWLCRDIESKTGERIGVNTVKRLTGVIGEKEYDAIHARRSTMDIIAHYLGYKDWNSLSLYLEEGSSDFKVPEGLVALGELPVGTRVLLSWDPDRKISMRHLGEGRYLIEKSEKSKLTADDVVEVSQVLKGHPFLVKNVIRNGRSLGPYTAASAYGLTSLTVGN